jgi:hypothetical protein
MELDAEPEDAAEPLEDATTPRVDSAETHEPAAEPADAMTIDDATPKVTTEEGRSSKQQAESDADNGNDHEDQTPPKVPPRTSKRKRKKPDTEAHAKPSTSAAARTYRKPFGLCAKHGLQTVITAMTAFIGLDTLGEHFHDVTEKKRQFEMRNDTEGAGLVAYYASVQVCAMAKGLGFTPAFISPEPKNQRQARLRPDADLWQMAEKKELHTLWDMGTFEVVSKPTDFDPLPLQFIYKLRVVGDNSSDATYKARLVAMGDLQYDCEYKRTHARVWTTQTFATAKSQESLIVKFDLTSSFLIADMDRPLYVIIPGYHIPVGRAIQLNKAIYGGNKYGLA